MKHRKSILLVTLVALICAAIAVAFLWHPWKKTNSRGALAFADGSDYQAVQLDCPECLNAIPTCEYGAASSVYACPSTGEEFGFRQATESEVNEYLHDYEIYADHAPNCANGMEWAPILQCDGKIHRAYCGAKLNQYSSRPVIEDNVFCEERACQALFRDKQGHFFLQTLTSGGRSGPVKTKVRKNSFDERCGKAGTAAGH